MNLNVPKKKKRNHEINSNSCILTKVQSIENVKSRLNYNRLILNSFHLIFFLPWHGKGKNEKESC